MNRPLYETKQDLTNEQDIMLRIKDKWKCDAEKLGIKYKLDFALTRDKVICAFAEVKVRKYNSTDFPDIYISLHKFLAAQEIKSALLIPTYLVVKWKDGLFYTPFESCNVSKASITGRTDRGDAQDIEPQVHIPIDYFKEL